MKSFNGKTVLITGGASGIGKIMARLLLEEKSTIVIWDMNKQGIDDTVQEYAHMGSIRGYVLDVCNQEQVKNMAIKVKEDVGAIDVLINNAGIIVGKYFHEHSVTDVLKTMDVNTIAPMLITSEFLPGMMSRNTGHICNIASSAGMVANPKMAVYAASKWALTGWSDSLRLEMQQLKKNINVTTIMPYYINTGMFNGVQSRLPILNPEVVAKKIITAIKKNKKIVTLPGYLYRLTRISQGLLGIGAFDWVADHIFGIYKTMEHFTGRK